MQRGRSEFWGMVFGHSKKESRRGSSPTNPLADLIAADIERTGKLIVDEARFALLKEGVDKRFCGMMGRKEWTPEFEVERKTWHEKAGIDCEPLRGSDGE